MKKSVRNMEFQKSSKGSRNGKHTSKLEARSSVSPRLQYPRYTLETTRMSALQRRGELVNTTVSNP